MRIPKIVIPVILIVVMMVFHLSGWTQTENKPDATLTQTPASTETPRGIPTYSGTFPLNYVRTRTARAPIISESSFQTASYLQVRQSTVYFDGLGRPLQTVARQATPGDAPKDIVYPVVYDEYGREQFHYLPYVQSNGTHMSDGEFKFSAFTDQDYFYKNVYKDASNKLMYAGEIFLYGQTVFETSPLNRIIENYAPGNSWAGTAAKLVDADKHRRQMRYAINTIDDDVQLWTVTNGALGTFGTYTAAPYQPGELYKTITEDEQGGQTIEFKNHDEKIVLKKVLLLPANRDIGLGKGPEGWLNTYYIYDDLGNLRCVIQPEGVNAMLNPGPGAALTSSILNEQCFRYEYDGSKRRIMKKTPGADPVEMVYDQRDRLVFSRDGNMRQKEHWSVILYDALNRPVITGILSSNQERGTLQTYVDGLSGSSTVPVDGDAPASITAIFHVPQRIAGITNPDTYQATQEIIFEDFLSEPGANFVAEIVAPGSGGNFTDNIPVMANPLPVGYTFIALTTTYYDDYSWTSKTYTDEYSSQMGDYTGISSFPEYLPNNSQQRTVSTKGMVTGSRVRVLEDPSNLALGKWLTTVNFYDEKGRSIQSQSDNYKGGTDITTTRYDFTDNVIFNYTDNNTPQQTPARIKANTIYEYDPGARLVRIRKTINNETDKRAILVENSYDQLGNLKQKALGAKRNVEGSTVYTTDPLEKLDYNYNIRGWLKGINTAYANNNSAIGGTGATPWFGMELNYDWGSTQTALNTYNGNISAIKWRSKSDGEGRAYGFTYDAANRLLGADFSQSASGAYVNNGAVNFDMVMGDGTDPMSAYDLNGNIKAMKQWGMKGSSSSVIDQLTYSYYSGSNKLRSVEEPSGAADNKLGDFTNKHVGTADDYGYDLNGNMITDLNKGINGSTGVGQTSGGAIIYNHLNLPWKITVKDDTNPANTKGTITYIYDAAGNKLEKRVVDNSNTSHPNKITTYNGAKVYEDNILQFISHEEGRTTIVNPAGTLAYNHEYFIKDHLSNTRMVLTDESKFDVYPAATLEGNPNTSTDAAYVEKSYYAIDPAKIVATPVGVPDYPNNNGIVNNNPNSNTTANSAQMYKLAATPSGGATGLGITLKVMVGDKIDIYGKSYYADNNTTPNYSFPVLDVLTGLFGAPGSTAAHEGATAGIINGIPSVNAAIDGFLDDPLRETGASTIPKAYINYLLFDENFNLVSSAFTRVGAANSLTEHNELDGGKFQNIDVVKSGYIYVYASNESQVNVFFDNLQVVHTRSPLVEETHYYPFGLTMTGISSRAVGKLENKYQFNGGTELNTDFDISLYETNYRSYDPQLGRFHQIDYLASNFGDISPYSFVHNNPISFNDPLGLSDSIPKVNAEVKKDQVVLPTVVVTGYKKKLEQPKQSGVITATKIIQGMVVALVLDDVTGVGVIDDVAIPVLEAANGVLLVYDWLNTKKIESAPPIPDAESLPWQPGVSPGKDWTWKGNGTPESGQGNWVNGKTGQKLHPDFNHPEPKGPHWGLQQPDGSRHDIFPK